MSTAIVGYKAKHQTVAAMLATARPAIEALLPPGMRVERVTRMALNELARTPYLLNCNPASIVQSVSKAAELGLDIGSTLSHAYLLPYRDKKRGLVCQLIPGYKGLVTLALDSPRYTAIDADVVREGEQFEFARGTSPKLVHYPLVGSGGEVTCAYAVAHLKEGPPMFRVVPKSSKDPAETTLDKVRDEALGKIREEWQRKISPWVKWETEMQKKTALRALCKVLDLSTRLRTALALEQEVDAKTAFGARTSALRDRLSGDVPPPVELDADESEDLTGELIDPDEGP